MRAHLETKAQLRTILQPDISGNQAFREIQTKQEVDFIEKKSNHTQKKPANSAVVNIHPPTCVQQKERFVVTVIN